MRLEFALDPRDHKTHGGPEWVVLDSAELDDLPFSVSGVWDRELIQQTGQGIAELIVAGLERKTADGRRALVWLARKLGNIETPAYAAFDIRWRRVRVRLPKEADASPPQDGSSEPSSEADA